MNQSAGIGARPKVRFEASPEQSRSASIELFRHEIKRYSGYKPSCNSDVELPNPMHLKDDKHATQRRKSLAKSKKFTDKVRNPVPVTTSVQRPNNMIKQAIYDGKGSWLDFKSHFEACSKINHWTKEEKGLVVCLRGQAQGVLGNLHHDQRQNFDKLVRSLEERFSPSNQTELYRTQFRERRQRAAESLSGLGQVIRPLANLACPTAPNDVKETLAKEQFIPALVSSDMRLRIKQARLTNLNDAVRHAVELEAFSKAEEREEIVMGIYERPFRHKANRIWIMQLQSYSRRCNLP